MKYNPKVSSQRRKSRKAHFSASSTERRIIMSATLSKALRAKYGVRSMPIRVGDEVKLIARKQSKYPKTEGKVKTVYRKKYKIYIDGIGLEKKSGAPINVGFHPSNVEITKLHLDKNRIATLARRGNGSKKIDKITEVTA